MIDAKLVTAINKQIQHEQSNAHAYHSVALYFESLNLHGIAGWMNKQVGDETGHAAKFIEHLVDRGAKVELAALPAPKSSFSDPLEAVKHVLDLERTTTGTIHNLYELAKKANDPALEVLMHWYITEQVEEEQWAEELCALTEQFYKSPGQLYMLDHRWGKKVEAK